MYGESGNVSWFGADEERETERGKSCMHGETYPDPSSLLTVRRPRRGEPSFARKVLRSVTSNKPLNVMVESAAMIWTNRFGSWDHRDPVPRPPPRQLEVSSV
jgi:hypothetical protein